MSAEGLVLSRFSAQTDAAALLWKTNLLHRMEIQSNSMSEIKRNCLSSNFSKIWIGSASNKSFAQFIPI